VSEQATVTAVPRGARLNRGSIRPWLRWAVALGLVCFGLGCSTPQRRYNYNREPDPRRGEFVLGPADELRITVWRNPELSSDATVRPDGTVTMPLIGDLPAAGLTARALRQEIAQRLRAYVKEGAVVSVALMRVNSYRFTVAGKVNRVGMYAARHYVTVSEAIAMAGGPTRFAAAEQTLILRRDDHGHVRRVPIDYQAVAAGRAPLQDLVILPGDTLYVP